MVENPLLLRRGSDLPLLLILLLMAAGCQEDPLASVKAKFEKKDYAGSSADSTRAIKRNPKCAAAYELRANARAALGDLKEALADYTEALRLEPDRLTALYGRGVTLIGTRDLSGADRDLTKAIRLCPQDARLYWKRGTGRWLKRANRAALDDFAKAIELSPNFVEAHSSRGHLLMEAGDQEGALADLTRAIDLGSKSSLDFQSRGAIHLHRNNAPGRALADFDRAVELAPSDPFAYFFRGLAEAERGNWERASKDFTTSADLDPKATAAHLGLANVKQRTGDRPGAIAVLTRAVETHAGSLSYFSRGCGYFDLGRWEEALRDFRRVRELGRDFREDAAVRIWMCRARLGEREEAARELAASLPVGWEQSVAKFLVGSLSEAKLLSEASNDARRARAWFCIATVRSLSGNQHGASRAFANCVAVGRKNSFDSLSAAAAIEASR